MGGCQGLGWGGGIMVAIKVTGHPCGMRLRHDPSRDISLVFEMLPLRETG